VRLDEQIGAVRVRHRRRELGRVGVERDGEELDGHAGVRPLVGAGDLDQCALLVAAVGVPQGHVALVGGRGQRRT
jgi:hypothetical protein